MFAVSWPLSAQLGRRQVGVAALGVAAMAQAHELDGGINTGLFADLGNGSKEVPFFPRQVHFFETIGDIAGHYQRPAALVGVQPRRQLRPEVAPVVVD